MTSIDAHWGFCIREQVQLTLPVSSSIHWFLTVILTLRTWAVWNRNRRLTIILPILYTLYCTSSFIVLVRWLNSVRTVTGKWNFHAHS